MLIYLFYQVTISRAGGFVLTGYSETSGTEGEREISASSARNLPQLRSEFMRTAPGCCC
jgi:hypothetical protein